MDEDYTFDPVDTYEILDELFGSMFAVDGDEEAILRSRRIANPEKKMLLSFSMEQWSEKLVQNGYYRTSFTSGLVQRFIQGIEVIPNKFPQLHQVRLTFPIFLEVEVLKNITYHAVIRSPRVQVVEFRGKDIVKKIFDALSGPNGLLLLPDDFQTMCDGATKTQHLRTMTDFIAGITDRYAIEFYVRFISYRVAHNS